MATNMLSAALACVGGTAACCVHRFGKLKKGQDNGEESQQPMANGERKEDAPPTAPTEPEVPASPSAEAQAAAQATTATPPAKKKSRLVKIESLGISFDLPTRWKVAGTVQQPMSVVIALQCVDEAGQPVALTIGVMDLSTERYTLREFRDSVRSERLPDGTTAQFTHDDAISNAGQFEWCLRAKSTSAPLHFQHLLATRGVMGYIVQFMGDRERYDRYEAEVIEIARSMTIRELPPLAPNYIEVTGSGLQRLQLPTNWIITTIGANGEDEILLSATTFSQTKPEMAEIRRSPSGPWSEESVETVCKQDGGGGLQVTQQGGGIVARYIDSLGREVLMCAREVYAVRLRCLKASEKLRCDDSELMDILARYIDAETPSAPVDGIRFVNTRSGYSFRMEQRACVVESRVSAGNVATYAPEGMSPTCPMCTITTVKIKDPIVPTSPEEWTQRCQASQSNPDGAWEKFNLDDSISGGSVPCVSYEQVGSNPACGKLRARTFVIERLNRGVRYSVCWQAPEGTAWERNRRVMQNLIDSFEFI
eukprot:PhM_4_TR13168/c0_g1_i1/m.61741